MKKELPSAAAVIVFLILAATIIFLNPQKGSQLNPAGPTQVPYVGIGGLSFFYPNSYVLTQRHDSYEGDPIVVLTLVPNDVKIPDMSDGPTAISIIEVPNSGAETLSAWVKGHSISNFSLSPDHVLASTTVAGEPAVSYTHPGVYESKAVAVKHKGNIYILSVGSIAPTDQIYVDFQNILQTVQFK